MVTVLPARSVVGDIIVRHGLSALTRSLQRWSACLVASSLLSFGAFPAAAQSRYVGMEYEVWFPGIPGGQQYWHPRWGTPLLGTYSSNDPRVIDKHAQWISDIGVDFILIDLANNSGNALRGRPIVRTFIEGDTQAVFAEYQKLAASGQPHPKIVILLGAQNEGDVRGERVVTSGELQNEADAVYAQFVSKYPQIYFNFAGKPLLVVYAGVPAFSASPKWSDPRFTVRWMSGYLESQPNLYKNNPRTNTLWSWYDRDPVPAHHGESVEAVSVTQAYPGQRSWLDKSGKWPAQGRSGTGGRTTLLTQWNKAIGYNPHVILLNQWNEFGNKNRGAPGTGDQYSAEYSNDLEPTIEFGCGPMTAVQQVVKNWKAASLPAIDCSVPQLN
jgi:hypothetical protein